MRLSKVCCKSLTSGIGRVHYATLAVPTFAGQVKAAVADILAIARKRHAKISKPLDIFRGRRWRRSRTTASSHNPAPASTGIVGVLARYCHPVPALPRYRPVPSSWNAVRPAFLQAPRS